MDRQDSLRRTVMFRDLPDAELRALADRALEQRLARGEILFLAGEPARGMYVVVDGAVRASRESSEGREQVIHVERAGATFAEVPMFDDGNYPSTVIAEEDSLLLFLEKREVRRLCLEHPVIALAALKLLAGRMRHCAALVETLSLRDVDRRLARLLLAESRGGNEVELSLTHQQVAARIGSVREVVSRAFSRLQQHGLIQAEGKLVRIPDRPKLEAYVLE